MTHMSFRPYTSATGTPVSPCASIAVEHLAEGRFRLWEEDDGANATNAGGSFVGRMMSDTSDRPRSPGGRTPGTTDRERSRRIGTSPSRRIGVLIQPDGSWPTRARPSRRVGIGGEERPEGAAFIKTRPRTDRGGSGDVGGDGCRGSCRR